MPAPPRHDPNSPILKVNRAWRRITAVVVVSAISYKVWRSYTRYDQQQTLAPPGSFTGNTGVETVERKSKYEGAGNSYLGRKRGDRFS